MPLPLPSKRTISKRPGPLPPSQIVTLWRPNVEHQAPPFPERNLRTSISIQLKQVKYQNVIDKKAGRGYIGVMDEKRTENFSLLLTPSEKRAYEGLRLAWNSRFAQSLKLGEVIRMCADRGVKLVQQDLNGKK